MTTETFPSAQLSDSDFNSIKKLLLNSWSAEHALRITPIVNDEQYVQESARWTRPQAYYAVLFSARALLASYSEHATIESVIAQKINVLYSCGFYAESSLEEGFFLELSKLRISASVAPVVVADPVVENARLVELVSQVAYLHEVFICEKLGYPQYKQILFDTPEYLHDSFLADRSCRVFAAGF